MDKTLAEEAEAWRELREQYYESKGETDARKEAMDRAEATLFDRMEAEKIGSIRIEGAGNFVRAETQYGQIQDRAEFVRWAEGEMPELLETKERKKLVNELVRERLNTGEQLPPGVGFFVQQYVSLRA